MTRAPVGQRDRVLHPWAHPVPALGAPGGGSLPFSELLGPGPGAGGGEPADRRAGASPHLPGTLPLSPFSLLPILPLPTETLLLETGPKLPSGFLFVRFPSSVRRCLGPTRCSHLRPEGLAGKCVLISGLRSRQGWCGCSALTPGGSDKKLSSWDNSLGPQRREAPPPGGCAPAPCSLILVEGEGAPVGCHGTDSPVSTPPLTVDVEPMEPEGAPAEPPRPHSGAAASLLLLVFPPARQAQGSHRPHITRLQESEWAGCRC